MSVSISKLPTVWAMGMHIRFEADQVTVSGAVAAELAVDYLAGRGHRCCAAVGPFMDRAGDLAVIGGDRLAVFVRRLEQSGGLALALVEPRITPRPETTSEQREALMEQLIGQLAAAKPRPTGLFLWATEMVPGAYRCLRAQGLEPGRDIDVVTCNLEKPFLTAVEPKPAVIDVRAGYIGQRAVETLLWRIRNPDAPVEKIIVAPRLLEPGAY